MGLDGPDGAAHEKAAAAGARAGLSLEVSEFDHAGNAAVKNLLLARARGGVTLFLNDDVLPAPELLAAHVRAHAEASRGAMILGDAPWVVRTPDRFFDRLIRETSMIFFYDQMPRSGPAFDPDRDWGFRHAWTLNLSAPTKMLRDVGGFYWDATQACGYEDVEIAWRLKRRFGVPLLYRPDAVAWHDHAYEPDQYLERERELGRQAWGFASASPHSARDVFGRDIASDDELSYSRAFVEREARTAERLAVSFRSLAAMPPDVVAGPFEPALIRMIYEQHLPLKRWCWRCGLLAAAACAEAGRYEDVLAVG